MKKKKSKVIDRRNKNMWTQKDDINIFGERERKQPFLTFLHSQEKETHESFML